MADKRIKDLVQAAIAAGDFIAVDPAGAGSTYKVPAGQASGLATVDSAGNIAQPVGELFVVSIATFQTTADSTTNIVHTHTVGRAGIVLVSIRVEASQINGTPRGQVTISKNGSTVTNTYTYTDQQALDMATLTVAVSANNGDTIEIGMGIMPSQANGTNELKFWGPRIYIVELGGA